MVEDGKNKPSLPEGIRIETTNAGKVIRGIPTDGNAPFVFSLLIGSGIRFGDASVVIEGTTLETAIYLEPITFRSSIGGGALPLIAEELSAIPRAFEGNKGNIPPWYRRSKNYDDRFPGYIVAAIEKGENPDDPRFTIRDLQDDDDQLDELTKFLDIEITNEGDTKVKLRYRHPTLTYDEDDNEEESFKEYEGEILFKTGKNGGRFPIMAEVFTRIAERLAKAQEAKSKRDAQ